MEARPKRARIELLVRHADDEGFDVREIPSGVAYLQSRPERIPDPLLQLGADVQR